MRAAKRSSKGYGKSSRSYVDRLLYRCETSETLQLNVAWRSARDSNQLARSVSLDRVLDLLEDDYDKSVRAYRAWSLQQAASTVQVCKVLHRLTKVLNAPERREAGGAS